MQFRNSTFYLFQCFMFGIKYCAFRYISLGAAENSLTVLPGSVTGTYFPPVSRLDVFTQVRPDGVSVPASTV